MVGLQLGQGLLIAGRYRLQEHLGEGGMGTVWSATHVVTRREVAIKFLRSELQHRSDLRKRFLHEARAASALSHPNVIEILDVFELDDQTPVMVMELLEGETLGERLSRDERLSVEETAAIMVPVMDAVGDAHAAGVVHRDLKPENIFLTRGQLFARAPEGALRHDGDGGVKVLDFGIAKLTAEHYVDQSQAVHVTQQGAVLGTPRYMAPEQISNQGVDHHADIWSLGTILYECLSGMRPIEGNNMAEVVGRLLSGAIVPLSQLAPDLPPELSSLIHQMLSRDPRRRPDNLDEIGHVLGRYQVGRGSRPPGSMQAPSTRARSSRAAPVAPRVRSSDLPRPSDSTLLSRSHSGISQGQQVARSPEQTRSTKRRLWIGGACLLLSLLALGLFVRFAGGPDSGPALDPEYAAPNTMQHTPQSSEPPPATPSEAPTPPPTPGEGAARDAAKKPTEPNPPVKADAIRSVKRAASKSGKAAVMSVPKASSKPAEEALFSGRK